MMWVSCGLLAFDFAFEQSWFYFLVLVILIARLEKSRRRSKDDGGGSDRVKDIASGVFRKQRVCYLLL